MAHVNNSRSLEGHSGHGSRRKIAKSGAPAATGGRAKSDGAQIRHAVVLPRKRERLDTVRRVPRQNRAQDTALAIVTAAEQLLVQIGYARASTNAIAHRAGVSVGSLYQYFDDKEGVFRAVVERHRDNMKPLIFGALEHMADPKRDWVDVTLDLMREMAKANARNPRLMAAIETELGWLEHDFKEEASILEHFSAVLESRVSLPSDELAMVAQLTVMTVSHLSRWLVHGKPPELDADMFVAATGRMLRALLPSSQRAKRPGAALRQR